MDQIISNHSSDSATKDIHEHSSKHATQDISKAETNIEKARDMAVHTLQRNLVDLKSLKVIKVTREEDGWDVAVEVFEESSFIRSLGLPTRVQDNNIYAVTHYGDDFCSALGRRNLFATQFHPEKSGRFGLQLLERFARWNGVISTESAESEK